MFDRNGVGTYGAYHHKSELKRCNRVHFFFNPPKFAVVIAILEPANSTRTDNSYVSTHIYIADMGTKEVSECTVTSVPSVFS